MGQQIEVVAIPMGPVAVFDTDRSITGQDGMGFPEPPTSDGPPAELARRLFGADDTVDHVFVLSNTVSVRRTQDWEDDALQRASDIIAGLFIYYPPEAEIPREELDEQLRAQNYNSTISHIREHNEELWVMRVRPDEPLDPYKAGQYTSLALGYWEPRADEAMEELSDGQRDKLARRSYSVSSSIVDENGALVPAHPEDVEFYIVQVKPGEEEIPALTPRIFTKGLGDRIYMGRKFTGRYTLDGVEPTDKLVYLSTGTGEAPQNAMSAELLRRGHQAPIINVVCVRYRADLAYTEQQAMVEEKFPNYRFLPITTREPENEGNKVYIQDLITSGRLEEEFGHSLDPADTHVFLCGNPAMIGLPKWDDDGRPEFPEILGACQILHERGFKIDRHKDPGNVHYEEYWTE